LLAQKEKKQNKKGPLSQLLRWLKVSYALFSYGSTQRHGAEFGYCQEDLYSTLE
jgi:hypothetical protein